jgi:hypothetical protein
MGALRAPGGANAAMMGSEGPEGTIQVELMRRRAPAAGELCRLRVRCAFGLTKRRGLAREKVKCSWSFAHRQKLARLGVLSVLDPCRLVGARSRWDWWGKLNGTHSLGSKQKTPTARD